MIASLPGAQGFQCDVSKDEEITRVFQEIGERYNGKIHTLVHSVAFAPAEDLKNDFLLTSREGFRVAHDISVYSLIALTRGAAPLMTEGGSIITLSYIGRREGDAGLQRDGRGQSSSGGQRALSGGIAWPQGRSASTPSPPGRSRRWQHEGSAASRRF